jgi:hypothetical protein
MYMSTRCRAIRPRYGPAVVATQNAQKLGHLLRAPKAGRVAVVGFGTGTSSAPTTPEREAIWRQALGEAGKGLPAPLMTEISKRADLHGGSIAAAAAARIARVLSLYRGQTAAGEEDLRGAVRAELLKTGSSVQAARWTAK